MGYRSEVALVIKDEIISSVTKEIKNISSPELKMLLERADVYKSDDSTLYHWDYVKWYGDDVDALMINLNDIDQEHWYFAEIGEDPDHNTFNGMFYENPFNVGLVRQLEFTKY